MKFDSYRFAPELKKNISELGFNKPNDIQYKAITPILQGEDVLAIAQTGTGKTAAYAIPVINMLHQRDQKKSLLGIKCLVMVPTRELAIQITEVFNSLEKNTLIKTFSLFGGVDQDVQVANLEKGVDILVATPGRMFDLINQGFVKLNNVEILVLDEADKMLDSSFIRDIFDVIKHIPREHQTLFFSATINESIKKLAYSLVHNAIRIQISPKDPVAKNIIHSVAFIEMDDKRFFLERLIKEHEQSKILVFVRTKVRAERVCKALKLMNLESETLHSDKEQTEREKSMANFRSGKTKILIATDISARGIDISNVDYVVNYDLPDIAENYVHRIGRTGRGTSKGYAVSFCSPNEQPILREIEQFIDKDINVMEIKKTDYTETLDFGTRVNYDWKTLINEQEKVEKGTKPKGKKK